MHYQWFDFFFNSHLKTIRDTGGPNLCIVVLVRVKLANEQLSPEEVYRKSEED